MEILFFSVILSLFGHLVYGQACPPGIDVAQMCIPGQVSGRRVLIDTTTYRPDSGNCSCAFSTTSGVMKIVTGVAPNKQGCDSAIRLSSSSGNSMRFQCLMSGTYLDTSVHKDGAVTFEAYSQVYDTNYCLSMDATAGEIVTVTCMSDLVVEKSTSQIGDTTTTPAPVTSTSRTSTGDLVTSSAGQLTTSAGTKTSLADETTTFKTTPAYFFPEPMPADIETNETVGADTHNSSKIKTSSNDDIITSVNEKSATDTVSTMFTHPVLNYSVSDTMEQVVNNTAAMNHQSLAVEPVISETNNVDAQSTIAETNVTETINNTDSTVMDNTKNISVNNTANVDKENMTSKYSTNVIEEAAKDLYMTTPRSIYVEPVTTAVPDTVSNGSVLNEMYNNQNKTSESVPNDLMMSIIETTMTVEHSVDGTAASGSNVDSAMTNEQAGLKTNVNLSELIESTGNQSLPLETNSTNDQTSNASYSVGANSSSTPVPSVAMRSQPDENLELTFSIANPIRETATTVNESHLGNGNAMLADNETHFMKPIIETTLSHDIPSTPVPYEGMRSQPDENFELTFSTPNPIRETKFANQETTTSVNAFELGNGNAMFADNETHSMKPIIETTLSQDIPSTSAPVFLRPDAVSGGISNNSQYAFIGANTLLEKHNSGVNDYVDTNISLDSLSLNGMVASINQAIDFVPDNAASNASVTENNITSNASNEPLPYEGMRSQPDENFELTFSTPNPIRETKFANQETTTSVNAFELGNGNAMFVDNETHSMKPIIETTLSQDIPSTSAPVFLRPDAVSGGISNNSQDAFIGANTLLEKHDSGVNDYVDTNISLDSLSLNGMVAAIDQTVDFVPDNAASSASVTENNITSNVSNESVIITKQYNGANNTPIVSESLLSVDPISSTTQKNLVSETYSYISSSASVEMTSSTLTPVSETLGSAGRSAVLSSIGVTNHYNEVMLNATTIQYNDTSSRYSVNDNNTEQTDGSTYLMNVNETKLSSETITPPSVTNDPTQSVPINEEFIANDFINVQQVGGVANLADEQTTATGLTTQDFKTKTDATGTTEYPVLAKIHDEMFISNVQPSLPQDEIRQTSIEVTTNHVTVSKTSTVKQDQTSAIEVLGQGTTETFVHEKQTEESATTVHSTRNSIVSEQQTSEKGTTEQTTEPTTSGPSAQTVNSTQLTLH